MLKDGSSRLILEDKDNGGRMSKNQWIDSMHFLGLWTPKNWRIFSTHGGTYKLEKIQRIFWRDKTLRTLKNMKGCIIGANIGGQGQG